MRGGFGEFFSSLRDLARQKGLKLRPILCGPGSEAFKDFKLAIRSNPDAFNILLVDAESPVSRSGWEHLQRRGAGWKTPAGTEEAQCHLMVQAVEAWLVAVPDTLAAFYGQGFRRNALPRGAHRSRAGSRTSTALRASVQGSRRENPGQSMKESEGFVPLALFRATAADRPEELRRPRPCSGRAAPSAGWSSASGRRG